MSHFHGTVHFDPVKRCRYKNIPNVYQTSNTQELEII